MGNTVHHRKYRASDLVKNDVGWIYGSLKDGRLSEPRTGLATGPGSGTQLQIDSTRCELVTGNTVHHGKYHAPDLVKNDVKVLWQVTCIS